MMNITAATAHADQLAARIRDARCCDAINPCHSCRAMTAEVRAIRHAARVNALVGSGTGMGMLRRRLAAARV